MENGVPLEICFIPLVKADFEYDFVNHFFNGNISSPTRK